MRNALEKDNPYYPYILYYMPSINRFVDHHWIIVHDISDIFDTWELNYWKRQQQEAILLARDGLENMIFYLTDEEDEDMLDNLGWNESYGAKVERIYY